MVIVGKATREQQKVEIEERKTGKKHLLTREEMVQFFKKELEKEVALMNSTNLQQVKEAEKEK
jgi:hypothetical protein